MNSWASVANVIGAVGGIIGIVFGGLGIRYARAANLRESEEHRIFMARVRREEEEKEIARRKDALLRTAHEKANSAQSASTLLMVTLTLQTEHDRMAAWELSKEGLASVTGDQCTISIDKMPPGLRRGI